MLILNFPKSLLSFMFSATSAALQHYYYLPPTVNLDNGTLIGISNGITNKFLGIPFAQAPVGKLRLNLPVAVDSYTGMINAKDYGPACPQQASIDFKPTLPPLARAAIGIVEGRIYQRVLSPDAEDCLSINVVVPAGIRPDAELPVVVWIHGGAFVSGGSNVPMYDADRVLERSVEIGEPVIFVSFNYRLSAYGFLASKEVKEAGVGNLGLHDQRLALRWVQRYISAFGGDPTKVTLWGESAGAISVALHMLTNGGDTEGLFRGVFMQSGSPISVGDITNGQRYYDDLVVQTGCSGAADTLQCLRDLPYSILKEAVDKSPGPMSYQSLRLAWLPRVDGNFLEDTPLKLVKKGSVAGVPFVTGDCDDEGTLFSLANLNITTEQDLRKYLVENYLSGNNPGAELDRLLELYPAAITEGSPFDTGMLNALTPQYKRLAAIQGDLVFQAPRRFFLHERADKQLAWSYLSKREKSLPVLGSMHGSDLLHTFGGDDLTDFLVNFVAKLDPNGKNPAGVAWPQYTTAAPRLMTLLDDVVFRQRITNDDYRAEGMELLADLSLRFPI